VCTRSPSNPIEPTDIAAKNSEYHERLGWNQQLVTLGLGAGVIATAVVLGLLGGYFGIL
jgi:hypothetical protein